MRSDNGEHQTDAERLRELLIRKRAYYQRRLTAIERALSALELEPVYKVLEWIVKELQIN